MTKKCVALLEDVIVIEIEVVVIVTVALKEIEIEFVANEIRKFLQKKL